MSRDLVTVTPETHPQVARARLLEHGFRTLPVVDGRIFFVLAILIGVAITAVLVNSLKKPVQEDEDNSEQLGMSA